MTKPKTTTKPAPAPKAAPADKQRENSGERGRAENLTPWPKGVSGNPKGRPKGTTLSEAYRAELAKVIPGDPLKRTYAELVAAIVVRAAYQGNVAAAREIADRVEGKPRQPLDVDVTTHDWRELAAREGLSEADVIREARALISRFADDASDT